MSVRESRIQWLSKTCGVSLSSAAIKVTQLSHERCAVAISVNGKIGWSSESPHFRYSVRRKGDVHEWSHAIDLFTEPEKSMREASVVHPVAWLDNTGVPETIGLKEYSVMFQELNMVMTLLTVKNEDEIDFEFENNEELYDRRY